jgi:hypothetical protein
MDDPNTTLSQDFTIDSCRLLTCYNERQTWLPTFLCPTDEYLLGKRTLAAWAKVVCLVDHKPDLLSALSHY